MNNLLATLAVILSLNATPVKAENHEYKNTPEYIQMETDTREALKNCLNNENTRLENKILELENKLEEQESTLEDQKLELQEKNNEIKSLQEEFNSINE